MLLKILVPLLASALLLPGCASSTPQHDSLPQFIEVAFGAKSKSPRRWVQLSHISLVEELPDGSARLFWNEMSGRPRVGIAKHYTAAQLVGALETDAPPAPPLTTAAAP